MKRTLLAWALAGSCACDRGHTSQGADLDATEGAAAIPVPSASAVASATARGDAPIAWRGTYKSVAGTLYVPPELKISWKPSETGAGIGEGTISMWVDPGGRVRGELDGPLGPAALAGLAADGKLTATIVRRDPKDHGFAGTMIGTLGTDQSEGTLNVSLAEGGAIRSGTFVLSTRGSLR
jgi:hypothetical protein